MRWMEKHSFCFCPAEDKTAQRWAKDTEEFYRAIDYSVKVNISTAGISVTASRWMGIEEGEQNE